MTPAQWDALRSCPHVEPVHQAGVAEGWIAPVAQWRLKAAATLALPASPHTAIKLHRGGASAIRRNEGHQPDRTSRPSRRGSISIDPPDTKLAWQFDGPARFAHVYLPRELIDAVAIEVSHQSGRPPRLLPDRVGVRDPELRGLADDYLRRAAQTGTPPCALEMDARATMITLHVLARHSADPRISAARRPRLNAKALAQVTDFIEAHIDQPIRLARLAELVGLGLYQFSRDFRALTGQPPHAYVLERRVARARTLLADPSLALADVALAAGFSSQSHMTWTFSRLEGITPGRVRAQAAAPKASAGQAPNAQAGKAAR